MTIKDSESNQEKSIHGQENQEELSKRLSCLLKNEDISDFQQNFRIGHPKVSNTAQFYAPFMIQFMNRTRWVIFSTTSMRTDRIKGQQWDAYNLKALDTSVTKAILAYSPSCKDAESFKERDNKYTTNDEISAIDRVLDFNELENEIKKEAKCTFEEEVGISTSHGKKAGKLWDKKGKSFEKYVADILSSRQFFDFWKKGRKCSSNKEYLHFMELVNTFNLTPVDIREIKATSEKKEIGYLPSGGSPKTDVKVEVICSNGQNSCITISCKRSKLNTVSIHQYSADTFADVLDRDNVKLRKLLNDFQYFGNVKDLPPNVENDLKNELIPYLDKLSMWVVGGFCDDLDDSDQRLANYIVSYKTTNQKFSVHSVKDYCNLISKKTVMFGTPFNWTYASKQRGKSIQLKAPVI